MIPIEFKEQNTVLAKDQPEYLPLPAYVEKATREGQVISCWKLSFLERAKLLFTGRLWLSQFAFHKPLQPQRPSVNKWDQLNREYFEVNQ